MFEKTKPGSIELRITKMFVRLCTESIQGQECPVCSMPSHVKDIQTNRQLATAVNLVNRLSLLLNQNPQDEISTKSSAFEETTNNPMQGKTEEVTETCQSPQLRKTRRAAKIERKKQRLDASNKSWGIGTVNGDPCASCPRRPAGRRVQFDGRKSPPQMPGLGSPEEVDKSKDKKQEGMKSQEMETDDYGKKIEKENVGKKLDDCEKKTDDYGKKIEKENVGKKLDDCEKKTEKENGQKKLETKQPVKKNVKQVKSTKRNKNETETDDNEHTKLETSLNTATKNNDKKFKRSQEENGQKKLETKQPVKKNVKQVKSTKRNKNETETDDNEHTKLETSLNTATKNNDKKFKRSQEVISKKSNKKECKTTPQRKRKNSLDRKENFLSKQPWLSPSCRGSLDSSVLSSPLMKKNAKGETPLHVACIKGDNSLVSSLLKDGAVVNAKDNAGWTPLHEACNHGYSTIVSSLLDAGALINMPGMDNDTPLHDAVRNNRVDCVKILVARGANTKARNINGRSPFDLADTAKIKKALETPVDEELIRLSQAELSSTELLNDLVFVATGLNREEKAKLQKWADKLHAKVQTDFSEKVTHVISSVNNEGHCPRTMKYLSAVLTGKWIVSFNWVVTCLDLDERVNEEAFEVPGASTAPDSNAPNRSRNNTSQQLPRLFDGCHFYFDSSSEFSYPTPSKEELSNLIKLGGGLILSREPRSEFIEDEPILPYHAQDCSYDEGLFVGCSHYIIHNSSKMQIGYVTSGLRICHIPASWIMDSIAQFKLMELPILRQ